MSTLYVYNIYIYIICSTIYTQTFILLYLVWPCKANLQDFPGGGSG